MEKKNITLSNEGLEQDDLRQYVCLRKFERIVNQFDEMVEMVDAVTKPPKRRRLSNSKRNKTTSTTDAHNSASTAIAAPPITSSAAGEAESSKFALPSEAQKFAALDQIITRHLNDLQTDSALEFNDNLDK